MSWKEFGMKGSWPIKVLSFICLEGLRKTGKPVFQPRFKASLSAMQVSEYYHISLLQKLLMYCAGSEVLTLVVMKSYVFWVIMSYSLLKVSEHFR
jgi:hypothetical protein